MASLFDTPHLPGAKADAPKKAGVLREAGTKLRKIKKEPAPKVYPAMGIRG